MKLTPTQKLHALAYRFYQDAEWSPTAGDYYTTSRADLELYQIVSIEKGTVSTRYTEGTDAISKWPEQEFTAAGFGPKRVFVPNWILNKHAPSSDPVSLELPNGTFTYEERYAIACAVDSVYRTAETTPADATRILEELWSLGFQIARCDDPISQRIDTTTSLPTDAPDLTTLLRSKADAIRREYQLAHGRPCDCASPDSALYYGRAQGLEIAADIARHVALIKEGE